MRKRLMVGLLLCCVALNAQVETAIESFMKLFGGFFNGNAKEATQLLNNAELAYQSAMHLKEYADMVKHGKVVGKLQNIDLASEVWAIDQASRYGLGLSSHLQNNDYRVREEFPGYQAQQQSYPRLYARWTRILLDNISGQFRAGARNHAVMIDTGTILESLRLNMLNAEGRMQAAQVGASAGIETAKQLAILNQLMQSDADTRAVSLAIHAQDEATKIAASERFFTFLGSKDTGNPVF